MSRPIHITGVLGALILMLCENPYVEFEIIQRKNTKGVSAPRWVLRGLVAM